MSTFNTQAFSRPDLAIMANEISSQAAMQGFLSDFVMPPWPVARASGDYTVMPLENYLSVQPGERAPGSGFARFKGTYEKKSYTTNQKGYEETIDDVERLLIGQDSAGAIMQDDIAIQRLTTKVLRYREFQTKDIVEANAAQTSAAGALWTDVAGADPRADILAAKAIMRDTHKVIPNAVAMSNKAMDALIACDAFKEQTVNTGSVQMQGFAAQLAMISTWFGVPRVLISNAFYNSAGDGLAGVMTDIWDSTKIHLIFSNGGMDMREPTFGRRPVWTSMAPGGGMTVLTYREEATTSDVYRAFTYDGRAVVNNRCLHTITGVVA